MRADSSLDLYINEVSSVDFIYKTETAVEHHKDCGQVWACLLRLYLRPPKPSLCSFNSLKDELLFFSCISLRKRAV